MILKNDEVFIDLIKYKFNNTDFEWTGDHNFQFYIKNKNKNNEDYRCDVTALSEKAAIKKLKKTIAMLPE